MSEPTSRNHDRFERALGELRGDVHSDDRDVARIMRAVYRENAARWWRRAGQAAAIAAVMVLAVGFWRFMNVEPPPVAPATDLDRSFVQFVYVGPEAQTVSLVGSFNDWDPRANPLRRDGGEGVWSAEVSLPPGHHEYAFNVDGRWVPDDDAPTGASDEFGVTNSVILVQ